MGFHIGGSDGSPWGNVGLDGANQTSSATTTTNREISFQDTIVGAGGLPPVNTDTLDAHSPQVFSPNSDPANEAIPEATNPSETTFSQEYYSAFAENLDGWVIDEYDLTEEQVEKLIFSHMTGVPPDDTFVEAALVALGEKLEEIAQAWDFPTEQDRENWQKGLDDIKELYLTQLKNEYGEHFEAALLAYKKKQ